MALTLYHNITGSTGVTVELIEPGEGANNVKSITLTNVHATADATVSLFLHKLSTQLKASETFYILSTVAIPSDTSLVLDNRDVIRFDNSDGAYGLYITVVVGDTVDVLISI